MLPVDPDAGRRDGDDAENDSADEQMQDLIEASDDDTDDESIPDVDGMSVLHLCSGPDRDGSYSQWLHRAHGKCVNYDIVVDPSCDLLDAAAWIKLAGDIEGGAYHGLQAGPVCTTFSTARGLAGGPPLVRGRGRALYGFRKLTGKLKTQVDGDTLIADRVAHAARLMHGMGRPFLIEQPAVRKGIPHMFRMRTYRALRRLPGVRMRTFVQCPFGSSSEKRTSVLYFGLALPTWRFRPVCPHRPRWFRFTDTGEWAWKRHEVLLGKRRMVAAGSFVQRAPRATAFLTKAASAYPVALNRHLATAMLHGMKRARKMQLKTRLQECRNTSTAGPSGAAGDHHPTVVQKIEQPFALRGALCRPAPRCKRMRSPSGACDRLSLLLLAFPRAIWASRCVVVSFLISLTTRMPCATSWPRLASPRAHTTRTTPTFALCASEWVP